MRNRYTIYFRPHQNKDLSNSNIVYVQTGNVINSTLGNEPNYTLTDVTDDIDGFKTSITFERLNDFNKKGDNGISERLVLTGKAYTYVKNYFFSTNYGHINSIDVIVIDNENRKIIKEFILKADTIHEVPSDGCVMDVTIKEANSAYDLLSKCDLHDNWQNWFDGNNFPNVKQFPTFRTCIQKFGASQRLGLNMLWITIPSPLAFAVNISNEDDRIVRKNLGLGNFTTAPYVRELIENVCAKAGLTHNTIFDSGNEYQNICYVSNNHTSFHINNLGGGSPATWFSRDNREATLFIDWIEKLADVFACYWWVENGVLNFDYKINIVTQPLFYSFLNDNIYNISIDYGQIRKDRRHGLVYATDDTASGQINVLYSDITDYSQGVNNPMMDGNSVINSDQFASTGFVRDGTVDDYIRESIIDAEVVSLLYLLQLSVIVTSLLGGGFSALSGAILLGLAVLWGALILIQRNIWLNNFADFSADPYTGSIRLANADTFSVGRLLDYNPNTPLDDAHVLAVDNPTPNINYNSANYKQVYSVDANPNSDSNNFGNNGIDYRAFNYRLYYDHKFEDNLQNHHEPFYNPLYNNKGERVVEFTVCKSADLMDKFGLYVNNSVKIYKIVEIKINNKIEKILITKITLKTFENELVFFGNVIYH